MSDIDTLKQNFIAFVRRTPLDISTVSWHLQQTTAIEGIVEQGTFLDAFEQKKEAIADALFDIITEESGSPITMNKLTSAWAAHTGKNPFFAANLAMIPKAGPQASFTKRQSMLPSRRR